ncbi:MAG: hypothetical protein DMF65_13375, partial [Acidobacteria bacterium]
DPEADPSRSIERANRDLARHQHVRRWHVWPETDFPRTPTQKVRKRDILDALTAENSDAGVRARRARNGSDNGAGSTPSDPVASVVTSLTSPAGGEVAHLNPSAKLSTDLKLDSLGRVELLSALEDRYQIEIDEASFTAATTLGDIERIVRGGGEPEAASHYPYPAWTQRFPFTWLRLALLYAVVLPVTALLCWLRVRGKEHLRVLNGPALFVSNHITYFDHALILSALPGRFRRRLAVAMEGERLRWWRQPAA